MVEADAVVVTAAAAGIGAATARKLGALGYAVTCVDIEDPRGTAERIASDGGRAAAVAADTSSSDDWERVIEAATAAHGTTYGLVNVVGVGAPLPDTVLETTIEDWDRVMSVNVRGTWLGMRAVLPAMLDAGRGRIVNMTSAAGLIGVPRTCSYSTSKAALIGLTRQAAIDYGARGVRINAVAPGTVATGAVAALPEAMQTALAGSHVTNRLGSAEDIAEAVAFLLSGPGGEFVTGAVLTIDGGMSARAAVASF